jgi:hypothetical protein
MTVGGDGKLRGKKNRHNGRISVLFHRVTQRWKFVATACSSPCLSLFFPCGTWCNNPRPIGPPQLIIRIATRNPPLAITGLSQIISWNCKPSPPMSGRAPIRSNVPPSDEPFPTLHLYGFKRHKRFPGTPVLFWRFRMNTLRQVRPGIVPMRRSEYRWTANHPITRR